MTRLATVSTTLGRAPRAGAPVHRKTGASSAEHRPTRHRLSSRAQLWLGFAAYLLLSLVVWWGVWSSHPTSSTTCGCGDASLFISYLEWPAYALAHGHNPFFSGALAHPGGVNLLSNTSETAIGVLFAPITWLFGPVATLNVASTLSPALSGLAMFWLVRRWVSWTPAAFVSGLLYGFSPFILVNLTVGHLMLSMLVVPPLIVGCLDELLVRQSRGPVRLGVVLALLITVQFFLGTELLGIMAVTGVVAVVLLVAYGLVFARPALRQRLPGAWRGLATATALSVALLAYPAWFALAGPAHLSGLVWPTIGPGIFGLDASTYWRLSVSSARDVQAWHQFGGYQGSGVPNHYFGVGLLVVLGAGTAVWFRDRRLWFFGLVGLATVALSFGILTYAWVPWRVLAKIPVVQNILADRFVGMTYLCAAVMLGIIVDRTHRSIASATMPRSRPGRPMVRAARAVVAPAIALAVALAALFQMGAAYSGLIPFTVVPVVLPAWFTTVAPHLPPGQVVQTYPAVFSGMQSALVWQAVDRMPFAMGDVGIPQGIASRAGKERPGFEVIAGLTGILETRLPPVTPATIGAVRRALTGWGVTTVVIPDQPTLPAYLLGKATSYALGFYTAAIGERPQYQAHAWVWNHVDVVHRSLAVSGPAFVACVGHGNFPTGPRLGVPDCILAAAHS